MEMSQAVVVEEDSVGFGIEGNSYTRELRIMSNGHNVGERGRFSHNHLRGECKGCGCIFDKYEWESEWHWSYENYDVNGMTIRNEEYSCSEIVMKLVI
jgi:hypothetical protein